MVVGHTTESAQDADRMSTFELFGNGVKGVTVVSPNMLFPRASDVVELLEGGRAAGTARFGAGE